MLSTPDPYGAAANVNIISSRRLSDLGILTSSQRYHTPKATGKRVLSCICYIRYIRYIRAVSSLTRPLIPQTGKGTVDGTLQRARVHHNTPSKR